MAGSRNSVYGSPSASSIEQAQDPLGHLPVVMSGKLGAHLLDDARRVPGGGRPAADRGEAERESAHDGQRQAQDPTRAPHAR